jgi:hypothetical protein
LRVRVAEVELNGSAGSKSLLARHGSAHWAAAKCYSVLLGRGTAAKLHARRLKCHRDLCGTLRLVDGATKAKTITKRTKRPKLSV